MIERPDVRIGIESTHLTRSLAGIGFYLYNILKELAAIEGGEEYFLFYNRPLVGLTLPSRIQHVLNGPRSTHLWAQTRLASLCRRHGIDLLHSPGQALPLWYRGKSILTVHDLSPLIDPAQKDWAARLVWTKMVPLMARQADHIITVSHHTKGDAIELLGIAEEKITCIHEAAGEHYFPEPDTAKLDAFRKEEGIEGGHILSVSTLEPRKNYPFLLMVFAQWLERSKPDATLVIVGKKGWLYDEIFETVERLGLHKKVKFAGYVGDPERMRLFYAAADCLCMTPLYEGFWLPGLEALACGTPVIAPKHSSIPEVIGDAGILIDGWDIDAWVDALDRMWKSTSRDMWSKRGIERAAAFSWAKAAREHLAVYRRVLGE